MSVTAFHARGHRAIASGPSFRDLVRSEWIKIRTVRATVGCLVTATFLAVGISGLIAYKLRSQGRPLSIDVLVNFGHAHLMVGQLALVVLAVTSIGTEYRNGMIRVSLTAVPWRRQWITAKALVVAVLALATGVVLSVVSFALVYAAAPAVSGRWTDPGVLRAILGGGLYLGVLAVFSLAMGAALRSTAGGVIAVFTIIFVVPTMLTVLSGSALSGWGRFLPLSAGAAVMRTVPGPGGLEPWTGFAVLCAWAAAAFGVAVYLLDKRDA